MADVEDAFVTFMNKVPFYGACVACCDDERLSALLPRVSRRVFTYGTSSRADYVLRFLPPAPAAEDDTMLVMGPFELHVPGRHNVLNATAAVAIAHQLDVAPEKIIAGLDAFRGVDRRFQVKGCVHGITVVDDYGHHPTEIRATLRAARDCHYARVHVIFQPHRYTRTRDLLSEFATAFVDADSVQVLDIYAASEEPIPGVDAQSLVAAAAQPGIEYAPGFTEAIARVLELARSGDVILTLGAGSVAQAAPLVLEQLRATSLQ
jgi:UDP-N-acetylmuramate--alanine ligase